MKKIKNIATGYKNLITGENKWIGEQRMLVCTSCPIHHNNFCISKLGGCGCYLPAKVVVKEERCPKGYW